MKMKLFFFITLISMFSFAQNTVSGTVADENGNAQGQVLILNFTRNQSAFSNVDGSFSIYANTNDELRFVKEGFYRFELIVNEKVLSQKNIVTLKHLEILIPEVEIQFQPTGNLDKDARNVGISKRVAALNSKMDEYMKSPLATPNPTNIAPKSFQPHDFKEGQVSLIGVADAIGQLLSKKTTKANYYETKDFIARIKSEVDLSYYRKFGMSEEGIDRFLLYAEDVFMLSKKYRKKFDKVKISNNLMSAFQQYKKTNDLEL